MFGIASGTAETADVAVGQTIHLMANGKPTTLEVSECTPPDFVQLKVDQSGMVTHWDYALDAVTDAVTHLELTVWCEISGWKAITAPAVHMILRKGGAGQPTALANHIEGR